MRKAPSSRAALLEGLSGPMQVAINHAIALSRPALPMALGYCADPYPAKKAVEA